MTSCVYRLHSTLELQLDDVYEFFDNYELPDDVVDVDITRRNNTLIISAVAGEENEISKYTPTAQLKASIAENRIYETEDGWSETPPDPQHLNSGGSDDGPQWGSLGEGGQLQEQEVEINSKLVEYACFKGDRETVLQNTALQYPMFEVLHDLAKESTKGTLTAIVGIDDSLQAVRIVDGEERAASIEVVDDPQERGGEGSVNWRDNEFIS